MPQASLSRDLPHEKFVYVYIKQIKKNDIEKEIKLGEGRKFSALTLYHKKSMILTRQVSGID